MKPLFAILLLLFALPSVAAAKGKKRGKGRTARAVVTKKAPRPELRLDEVKVEGRIQKPQAFYILQRSSLDLTALERNESLLPRIVQSVDREPF